MVADLMVSSAFSFVAKIALSSRVLRVGSRFAKVLGFELLELAPSGATPIGTGPT
jgi:hypothetical protein